MRVSTWLRRFTRRKNLSLWRTANCRFKMKLLQNPEARLQFIKAYFVTEKSSVYAGLRGAVYEVTKVKVFYKLIGRHMYVKEVRQFNHLCASRV